MLASLHDAQLLADPEHAPLVRGHELHAQTCILRRPCVDVAVRAHGFVGFLHVFLSGVLVDVWEAASDRTCSCGGLY